MIYLVFDNLRKPPNVGAAVRLSVATGFPLYLTGNSLPHTHRKALSAAVGYADQAEVHYYDHLNDAVDFFRSQGITVVGTSPYADKLFWDHDFQEPTAVVFGNEATGLGRRSLALLDDVILIPMPGNAESLNVVTSAAVVAFEALRQRFQGRKVPIAALQGKPDRS